MRVLILSSRCTVEQRCALSESRAFLEGYGDTCEILDWLSTHDVQEYVIIDDDEWEFETYGMAERWIQTHTDLGITGVDAAVAIKILEGDC